MKNKKEKAKYSSIRNSLKRAGCCVLASFFLIYPLYGCSEKKSEIQTEPLTNENSTDLVIDSMYDCSIYNDYVLCDDDYKKKNKYKSEFIFSGADEFVSGDHYLFILNSFKFNLSMKAFIDMKIEDFSEKLEISADNFNIEKTGENESICKISCEFTHNFRNMYFECLMEHREHDIGYMIEIAPVQDRELVSYRLSEMFASYKFGIYPGFKPENGYPVKVRTDFAAASVPEDITVSFLDKDVPFSDGEYILDSEKLEFKLAEADSYDMAFGTSLSVLDSDSNKSAEKAANSDADMYLSQDSTLIEPCTESKAGILWPECDTDIRDFPVYFFSVANEENNAVHSFYYFNIGSNLIRVLYFYPFDHEKYEDDLEKLKNMINNVDFFVE